MQTELAVTKNKLFICCMFNDVRAKPIVIEMFKKQAEKLSAETTGISQNL